MQVLKNIVSFYCEGFKTMSSLGRTLWLIVFVKLVVMFLVLRLFFFQPVLSEYDSDSEKSKAVIENLTKQSRL